MTIITNQNGVALPRPNFKYITNEADARSAMGIIDRMPTIAVDTETTGLDPYEAKWTLLQIGNPDQSFVFDVRYDTEHSSLHPSVLDPILKDSSKKKLLQNAVYDMKIIKVNRGYYLENIYDTMLAEQLLTLGLGFTNNGLAALAFKYLGVTLPKEPRDSFADYNQKFQDFQLVYAANDVTILHTIMDQQIVKLRKENLLHAADLEFRFTLPMSEMELNGILLDTEKWSTMMGVVAEECDETRNFIKGIFSSYQDQNTLFGVSLINIDSNAQLKKTLSKMGLELESTASAALSKYAGLPVIDALLDYRKSNKLISTYSESLLSKISKHTGRLHTNFKQMVSTGRMSSSNPNLQNIPKKQIFRSCFVAKPGYSLVTADMSGAELRILGNYSQDPVFVNAYASGEDLHTRTAAGVFDIDYSDVKSEMRNAAKAINFGLCYGMSPVGLAARLKISERDAADMIDIYFNKYKAIKSYLDKAAKDAVRNRYSETISGRRRYYSMPPYDHPDRKKIQRGIERQGMNAGIQGCLIAGTIVKGLGNIENLVSKCFEVETGLGADTAVGVYSGKKEVYDLKLSNGVTIGITEDHEIPVVNCIGGRKDKKAAALNTDDFVMVPLNITEGVVTDLSGFEYVKGHWRETFKDFDLPISMTEDLSFIIGCLLGDGSYTKHNHFRFCCPETQIELFDKFNTCIEKVFGYSPVIRKSTKNRNIPMYTSQVSSVVLRGFMKYIGLDYVVHREKTIPKYFHTETVINRGALLNGLFSTDGSISKKSGISFTSTSGAMASSIQQLLLSLGVNSNLKEYNNSYGKVYRLQIFKRFNDRFLKYVSFSVDTKQSNLLMNSSTLEVGDGSIVPPFIPMTIAGVLFNSPTYTEDFTIQEKAHLKMLGLGKSTYSSWRKFYNRLPECKEKVFLSEYLDLDFCKIVSMEFRGIEDTYDIICNDIHYFVANGVIVHNSNADTIKESMVILVERLKNYDAKLILTVHDEVIIEVVDDQKYEVAEIVSNSLVEGFGRYFSLIPMETEALIGPSWLKGLCENKVDGKKCGNNEMTFVPGGKHGTKLVCAKCGGSQE